MNTPFSTSSIDLVPSTSSRVVVVTISRQDKARRFIARPSRRGNGIAITYRNVRKGTSMKISAVNTDNTP